MFFLKDLPSRRMVAGYQALHPDLDPDRTLAALHMMRSASLLIRRLEAYFTEHGLSQMRFLVLVVIDREPDRDWLTVGEVAERLDVSRPVTTRTLQQLGREGLVAVSSDAKDSRLKRVTLTEVGRARLHGLMPGYFRLLSAEPDPAKAVAAADRAA